MPEYLTWVDKTGVLAATSKAKASKIEFPFASCTTSRDGAGVDCVVLWRRPTKLPLCAWTPVAGVAEISAREDREKTKRAKLRPSYEQVIAKL